ncbi:MAG: hypothetical protein R6V85_08595 [Polyangia bacterium]
MRASFSFLLATALALSLGSCSKRQLLPGITAGAGAGVFAAGVGYRLSIEADGSEDLLGHTAAQRATTSVLVFSGVALMLAGVIWSVTTPICESDSDCWPGDSCDVGSQTCVEAPPEPASEDAAASRPAGLEGDFDLAPMSAEIPRLRLLPRSG